MKTIIVFIACFISINYCFSQKAIPHTYKIIVANDSAPGHINYEVIAKLSEPLKAAVAFYTAMGASCEGSFCHINNAFGVSDSNKGGANALIGKYFPKDSVAKQIARGGIYVGGEGSSNFTDFVYLTIIDYGNKIKVEYKLIHWSRGPAPSINGPDTYSFKNNVFNTEKRHLFEWTHRK